MRSSSTAVGIALAGLVLFAGCEEQGPPRGAWHRKYSWKADSFFYDQPLVIELCYAIEANDLEEMDRLVAAGADVNAIGEVNMTPLLWAYPGNKPDRFVWLLEHGANPNVVFESEFNTQGVLKAGSSVTHLALTNPKSVFFDSIFQHGGDPDFSCKTHGISTSPLITHLIKWGGPERMRRIKSLIDAGANLDLKTGTGTTPTMVAVGWGGAVRPCATAA